MRLKRMFKYVHENGVRDITIDYTLFPSTFLLVYAVVEPVTFAISCSKTPKTKQCVECTVQEHAWSVQFKCMRGVYSSNACVTCTVQICMEL